MSIEPKDIIHRKAAEKMSDNKLNTEIRKLVKRLNSRLSALEKSGYNELSKSYSDVIKYLDFTTGTKRFSSAGLENMPLKTKADYYAKLQHYNRFHLTKTQIDKDEERFVKQLNKFSGTNFTKEEVREMYRALNIILRDGSDEITRLKELMGSDEIRDFFITRKLNATDITENFMEDLKSAIRTFYEQSGPDGDSGYEGSQLRLYFEHYDPTLRKAIVQDPMTGNYFDLVTNEWVDHITGEPIEIDPITGNKIFK